MVVHHHLDPNAGVAGVTLQIAERLRASGHEVDLLSFDDLPPRMGELPMMATFPMLVAARLLGAWMRGRGPDVVDASTGDTWLLGLAPRRIRRSALVVRSHGLEHVAHLIRLGEARRGRVRLSWKYPIFHGGVRLWQVALSLRRADATLFLNAVDRRYAVERLGVRGDAAHVIGNSLLDDLLGLPVDFAAPVAEGVRIVQIGRYTHEKGVSDGSPALAAVLARHPRATVAFLGTACAAARVHADFPHDVLERIEVVPRFGRAGLPALLAGAHIVLAPSLTEGWGTGVAEAMAVGAAPVATANRGALEIVRDGVDGIVVPVGDAAAIETALLSLIDDPARLARLRRAAYRRAQEFRWADRVDRLVDVYRDAQEAMAAR